MIFDDLERAAKAWDDATALQKNIISACGIFWAVLLIEFCYFSPSQF